jgi:tRNA-Thr(GGU) m(6)t(6)A37 methyltransferase TsaA
VTGAPRPGEIALDVDPEETATLRLAAIGRIATPWGPGDCPRNLRRARETGRGATITLDPPYRPGLRGLAAGRWIMVLYWLGRGRRDLIVQAPRHAETPLGVFAIRSPVRPNPVGLACVRIERLAPETGEIAVDALDCFDGTPLIDLKPWIATVDAPTD